MIASWMVMAMIFTLFVGLAALASERALRTVNREGRAAWITALAVALVWPVLAPLARNLPAFSDDGVVPVVLPAVQSAIEVVTGSLPSIPNPWLNQLDLVLVACWVTLSLILIGRLLVAMRSLAAVERNARPAAVAGVPVLVTSSVGPAVFGIRRIRFLVPQWLLDLDEPLRELVMLHEREHLRARDPQLTLLVAIAVALMPWNPGIWWIARRLRLAMELDCDTRVLRTSADRERYAKLLVLIAQRQTRNAMATMLAASTSDLTRRISGMNRSRPANAALQVAGLSLVTAVAIACSGKVGADIATSPVGGSIATTEVTYYSPEGATPAVLVEQPSLVYPTALRSTGVRGEVLAMFVVDSTGRVLDGSLRIVRSADSLFTQAVRGMVADMRFDPPRLNGRNIRQLVQQSFVFDPQGATSAPTQVARPTTDPTNRNPMPLRPIVISRQ